MKRIIQRIVVSEENIEKNTKQEVIDGTIGEETYMEEL